MPTLGSVDTATAPTSLPSETPTEESRDEPHAKAVEQFARERGLRIRFIPRMDIAAGTFGVVDGGTGGHCESCNRLRLSADGRLRPCLFSDLVFNIREMGHEKALKEAVAHKPSKGGTSRKNSMYHIGG